jgi:hypothetical protein
MSAGLDFSMHLMLGENRSNAAFDNSPRLQVPIHPGIRLLRRALRRNIVAFPSQVPVFAKDQPDGMQWRMVLLYFVRGWHLRDIVARFRVPAHRVCQLLNTWSVRALALGYVEIIDPEAFAECCRVDVESQGDHDREESHLVEQGYSAERLARQFPQAAASAHAAVALLHGGTVSGDEPGEWTRKNTAVIEALDAAILHCEGWSDEFWLRTATLLRDLRKVAVAAIDSRPPIAQTDGRFTALPDGKSNARHELRPRDEEHASHAVA